MINSLAPTTATSSYDLSELYQFFSNRNLLQFPKSIETITSDISEEYNSDSRVIINSYMNMKKHYIKITNEVCDKEIQKIYNNSSNFKKYMKMVLDSQINEYKDLCAQKKVILNNLYRITVPNYIFTFVIAHKDIFPSDTIEKILPLITNITYIKNNYMLNNYIKRAIIMKILIDIDRKNFIDYYNYCRFNYMYDRINALGLTSKAYNINSGALYFTLSYNKSAQMEQIFEKLRNNSNNSASINIEEVKLYINSSIGEISTVKKLYDRRWKKFHTKVIDNISYYTPNIIRKILHNLISKFSEKSYKYSYNQMLGYLLRKDFIVEDYCEKVGNDGKQLRVPINNEWKLMSSKEVRRLTINDINIKLVLDSYETVLKPILQAIINLK